jgi:large subunit ribosomal protein L29
LKTSEMQEMRDKSVDELEAMIRQYNKDLFELRSRIAVGQVPNPQLMRKYKKNIARCNTLITEKQRAEGASR